MAIHQNLKPSDQEIPLLLAGQALSRVDGLVSRPMGAVSVDNADGSSTLIGGNTDAGSGDSAGDVSGGVIKQVGKTSLPGTPSGLSVSSIGLTVVLTWDGSFTGSRGGAVRVEAVLTDADGKTISMGSLTGAGVLTAIATAPGMASVAATAYDDAHDQTGVAAPNHSDTVTLDIVLSELVDSQQITDTVDANKKTLEQANRDLAQAKTDIASAASTAQSAKAATEANKKTLEQANKDLAQAKTDIMAAASTAQSAKATAEENKKTLEQANRDLAQAKTDITSASSTAQSAKTTADANKKTLEQANKDLAQAKTDITAATSTAQSAKAMADAAKTRADKAVSDAASATSAASTAQRNAATALTSANTALQRAKNITVSSTRPANPATGDIWYPQDDSGRVIGMKTWDGSGWVDVTIMAGSIIVPGSIGSTLIGDGQITTGKLAAGSVTADSMAADAVTARSLAVGDYTNLLDDSLLEKTSTDNQLASRWGGHNLSWIRDAHVPGGTGNVLVVRTIKDEKTFNPFVQNIQQIPCKGGDTFYAGAYVLYWNDVKATMKVQLKVIDLDNQKTYYLNAGTGTADIGQWQWVDGAATIPASVGRCTVQVFIFAAGYLNQWTDSTGTLQLGYHMVYNPVLRHGVGGTQIADGAVSTSKIIAGSITGDRLAANTVNADKLASNSVTADKLAANSVTADKLTSNSVTASKIVAGSITGDRLAANTINSDKLAANSVTADKLAANSVTASKIVAGSITGDRLAANAVTADKIAANAVNADKLAANSVTADKLAASSVTAAKLAANSVTADKIVANSITGDRLAANTVNADKLAANSVTADKLAANSVNADKLAANSVTADKIAAGSISASKIAAGSITADKLRGNRLVGAQIQTNENAPYMLMTSQKFTVNPEKGDTYNSGVLQFIGKNNAVLGGLMFGHGDSPNNNMSARGDYAAYLTVENPEKSHDAEYVNQIEISDIDDPDGGDRRIDISSRYVSIGVNEDGTNSHRSYDFSNDGLRVLYTDASGLFSEQSSGYLSAHRTLFHNDNQPSAGVITLDDDITKYWKLEFEFKTNDGVYFGMPVYRPSVGKRFNASTIWYGFDNLPWLKTRAYVFTSSRTVDCVSENNGTYWRTGQQVMGNGWKVTPGDFISVTHVEGFFN